MIAFFIKLAVRQSSLAEGDHSSKLAEGNHNCAVGDDVSCGAMNCASDRKGDMQYANG